MECDLYNVLKPIEKVFRSKLVLQLYHHLSSNKLVKPVIIDDEVNKLFLCGCVEWVDSCGGLVIDVYILRCYVSRKCVFIYRYAILMFRVVNPRLIIFFGIMFGTTIFFRY